MTKHLETVRDMLCEELAEIAEGGEVRGHLADIDKLTHSIKSIDTTLAMQDAGYSYDGPHYRDGMSGARARSRTTGRYVSRDGRRNYERRGGMSYDGARDELMAHVDELADMAKDDETRAMIQKFKRELKDA